jgi:hypothetical protein
MDIKSLKLLLEEVTRQVTDRRILLFGSSSLLASYPEEEPDRIGVETTIDADFFLDPDDKPTRDALYAELGEDNAHQTVHGCRRHLRGGQRGPFGLLTMCNPTRRGPEAEGRVPRFDLRPARRFVEAKLESGSGFSCRSAVSAMCGNRTRRD